MAQRSAQCASACRVTSRHGLKAKVRPRPRACRRTTMQLLQFCHLGCLVDSRSKRQKLTQLLPKSRSAVLGLHTYVHPGALDDGAGSFDSLVLEAHVVALLGVHRAAGALARVWPPTSLLLVLRGHVSQYSRRVAWIPLRAPPSPSTPVLASVLPVGLRCCFVDLTFRAARVRYMYIFGAS
jgi:hypothetical protein